MIRGIETYISKHYGIINNRVKNKEKIEKWDKGQE